MDKEKLIKKLIKLPEGLSCLAILMNSWIFSNKMDLKNQRNLKFITLQKDQRKEMIQWKNAIQLLESQKQPSSIHQPK